MEINKTNIINLVKEMDIVPSKNNGQNFLCDGMIAERIVNLLNINKDDVVLEIGPGLGSLTNYLPECTQIDVVDVDGKMCDVISYLYKDKNINVFNQDALKFDVSKYSKIISNVPYSISSNLLEYLLLNQKCCKQMTLMVEDEFFFRISARSGKEYGPLSILAGLSGDIERKITVNPGSFYPQPKCKSIVFNLYMRPQYDNQTIREIYKLIKLLFNSRRKTILNNLSTLISRNDAENILLNNNINPLSRAEQLSINDFVNIFFSLKNR